MDKLLLEQFFENKCTQEQRRAVIAWILDPANDQEMKLWMEHCWHFFSESEMVRDIDMEKMWNEIRISLVQEMEFASAGRSNTGKARRTVMLKWVAGMAASIILIFSFLIFFHNSSVTSNTINLAEVKGKGYVEKHNTQGFELPVSLPDGTTVRLQPNAVIYYPAVFSIEKREVYLSGEAFFDVAKNPQQPFFVYYRNLVTHVIGTSFSIRANPNEDITEVNVKTGRVEVYENKGGVISHKSNGVLLTANQKVTYYGESRKFETSVADRPMPLVIDSARPRQPYPPLYFEDARLTVVIAKLEARYGIEIVFENENFNNCLFTGDLQEENLYDILDIVCKSLSADYEIKGTRILIKGKGCSP